MKYDSEYIAPTLTVDAVIFCIEESELRVLLIKRSNEPFKGFLALPGGYSPAGETTQKALCRIVHYKTGIDLETDVSYMEQLYTFDTIARDPRGHAVSVVYMASGQDLATKLGIGQDPQFFSVDALSELPYDHLNIILLARDRLRSKLMYTNVIYSFLPPRFTLTQLQSTYEIIMGQIFDKRNFRKKFLGLDFIKETGDMYRVGAHRPAKLYEFKDKTLITLLRDFS